MDTIENRLYKIMIWQTASALQADSKKESFLASAFHEVRNPVHSLVSLIENAKHEEKDVPASKLSGCTDHILSTLNNVLDLTKLSAKGISNQNSVFLLLEFLIEIESDFKAVLENKNLKWIADYNFPSAININTDKNKLIQVLTNLIGNACKFTTKGFIKLTVNQLAGGSFSFSVEDSGRGISPWHLSTLFDEFKQVETHKNAANVSGTGLGLPICNGLLTSMGSTLKVESEYGKGSTFSFVLFSKKFSSSEKSKKSAKFKNPLLSKTTGVDFYSKSKKYFSEKNTPRSLKRVLYIDDDAASCDMMVGLLKKINVSCDVAHSGAPAISLCSCLPNDYYTIILTDIHLAAMDGISIGKVIKHFIGSSAPIIAISASSKTELAYLFPEHVLNEIFANFLRKPIKLTEFYRILGKYLPISKAINTQNYEFAEENINMKALTDNSYSDENLKTVIKKHRLRFSENNRDSDKNLYALFEKNDFTSLANSAHSLKGLTGTLGYKGLLNHASKIENLAREFDTLNFSPNITDIKKEKLNLAIENYSKALQEILI